MACRRQAIIWTNDGILLIGPLGTNFNEIVIEIHTLAFKKMHSKLSSAKSRLFRPGLNVLSYQVDIMYYVNPPFCRPDIASNVDLKHGLMIRFSAAL